MGKAPEYEQRTNTHCFEEVVPLIADEKTWTFIQDEHYAIENMQWLVEDQQSAVCVYLFRWQGKVEGQLMQGMGRGTSVLKKINNQRKVIHEHLNSLPE